MFAHAAFFTFDRVIIMIIDILIHKPTQRSMNIFTSLMPNLFLLLKRVLRKECSTAPVSPHDLQYF